MVSIDDIPSSVYRIQFGEQFTLKDAIELLPYLIKLGVEGIYCSSICESASHHGYDVTNPNRIDPAIGTLEEYEKFCALLQQNNLKQVLDVIPNHMSIRGNNAWWTDVLAKGQSSPYAGFFDINWHPEKPELRGKVLLPILKDSYGKTLEDKQLRLIEDQGYWIQYEDYLLPIAAETDPKDFASLHELLEKQHYRLAHWLAAGQEINYRRFFNINELAAIHIEKEKVLQAHHQWVFDLIKTKKVQGLRIDHPDGLYDPAQYFDRIQTHNPSFVIVEKILDFEEPLRKNWNIEGTVGYGYLNVLSGVFVQRKNERKFNKLYKKLIGRKIDLSDLLYDRKKWFIWLHMGSETQFLSSLLSKIVEKDLCYRDFTRVDLMRAVREILASFPVYRTYIKPGEEIGSVDRGYILQAIEMAKDKSPEIEPSIYAFLKRLLLLEYEQSADAVDFIARFQQTTAPCMAKGLEDSTYFIYNRLISLNEVGSNLKHFGFSQSQFHRFNQKKRANWPLGFLTSSTHDTKLSEDVRMRLNVLSEIPQKWEDACKQWQKLNEQHKAQVKGALFPDPNTEYYLYQMLLGVWPDLSVERLWKCFLKTMREAGIYTNWRLPNEQYEKAAKRFLEKLLEEDTPFYSSFSAFTQEIAAYGRLNSLSSLVLKMGSCGIVDIYQGNESWNFCLTDPDNRRPVDYNKLQNSHKEDKLFVTSTALNFRKRHKELLIYGDYIPLHIENGRKANLIAFMRRKCSQIAIFCAACFYTELPSPAVGSNCWGEAELILPKDLDIEHVRDVFTQKTLPVQKKKGKSFINISEMFQDSPFSILLIKEG